MTSIGANTKALLSAMEKVVSHSNKMLLEGRHDSLIRTENVNFFTKSYLIMLCIYLEAYVKDVAMAYEAHFNVEMNKLKVPRNLIVWSVDPKEVKDLKQKFEVFKVELTAEDIDKVVSPNPDRIFKLFKHLGMDLESNVAIKADKDVVMPIIGKRNRIVHYNDNASDITFPDVISYIKDIKRFIRNIDAEVEKETLSRGFSI